MAKQITVNALLAALLLTGCGREMDKLQERRERKGMLYREAMAEYSAGKLDSAEKLFERILTSEPDNASVRFQLACLQQDRHHDYLGAICNYREYLRQSPKSDKSEVARERMELCERLLAPVLAKKMNLLNNADLDAENERLKTELADAKKENEGLQTKLSQALERMEGYAREGEQLRRMLREKSNEKADNAPMKPIVISDEALLDEIDDVDRIKISNDVGNLLMEEKAEIGEAPFAESNKGEKEKETKKIAENAPPAKTRPSVYTVQDGDTLFQLAAKFYGRKSAWREIRDANKAIIPSDGRLRAGDTIKLP